MELTNDLTGEKYVISVIPLHEAQLLRKQGVVFYDFTKLTAVNTCPTFGVLRYALHRTEIPMTASGRNLAIEAGKACHDFFAAVRMWTLLHTTDWLKGYELSFSEADGPNLNKMIENHGYKLFGQQRWEDMLSQPQDGDPFTNCLNFSLSALHTSGYYDDPSDRKRTMANMEAACINYLQRYMQSNMPVAVKGDLIGVEIPFVLKVTRINYDSSTTTHYYCGRIDGVHRYGDALLVAENKTAANLSSSWSASFAISAQVTGYTIAGTEIFQEEVTDAFVMGTQIPVPRDAYNGVRFEFQSRTLDDRIRWAEWLFHSIETYEKYIDRPTYAPRYSHSCNRYFSACQFIPLCASPREEQEAIIDQLRIEEWSPLSHLDSDGIEE